MKCNDPAMTRRKPLPRAVVRRQYVATRLRGPLPMTRLLSALSLVFLVAGPAAAQAPVEVKAHSALVHSVAFSPDGKWFATAGFDKTAKLFEYANGQLKEVKTLTGHTEPVYCVAFSPDSKTLATSSLDKTIRLWNVAD